MKTTFANTFWFTLPSTSEDSKTCVAQTYYQASPSVGPAVTLLMCANSLQPWPNYRSLAGAQYFAPNASSLPWDSSSVVTTSTAVTNTAVGGGGGGGGNPHLWIAGAVLGPVVAMALGILAFWVLSRRQLRRGSPEAEANKAASSSSSASPSPSLDAGSQARSVGEEAQRQAEREQHCRRHHNHAELSTIHNLHELASPPATLELPAGQYPEYPYYYSWAGADDAVAPGVRPHAELDSTFSPVTPCLGPDGRPERPYKGWGWFGWV